MKFRDIGDRKPTNCRNRVTTHKQPPLTYDSLRLTRSESYSSKLWIAESISKLGGSSYSMSISNTCSVFVIYVTIIIKVRQ